MATPIAAWLTNFRSPEAVTSLDGFFVRMLASDGSATETRADPTGFPYGSERQYDDRSTLVEDGFHAAFRRTG
jgi:hypothetical protein